MSNATINTMNVTIDKSQATIGAVDPMRDAIITMATQGNPHAITNVEAALAGAAPEDFTRWTTYVRQLREVGIAYGKVCDKKESTKDELALSRGRVFEKWQQVIKTGEMDKFHPNMFIREEDADLIRVYANNMATVNIPGVGTVNVVTPDKIFRKMIETWLGLRIRANEALCDADRDLINLYQGYIKTIDANKKRLNGEGEGEDYKPGLLANLKSAQDALSMSVTLLTDAGLDEKVVDENPAIVALRNQINSIEADIAKANKLISDAEEGKKEKQEQYDRVISTINRIEAPARK